MTATDLVTDLWAKIDEQIDSLEHIIEQFPASTGDWKPPFPTTSFPNVRSVAELTRHLIGCLAGFLAALYAARPDELSAFLQMKGKPFADACRNDDVIQRIEEYRGHIRTGFAALNDTDLARKIPTVFVPTGESVATLLLGNFEHLVNHKHELFYYVKLLGIPLTSGDLYQFRGEASVRNTGKRVSPWNRVGDS